MGIDRKPSVLGGMGKYYSLARASCGAGVSRADQTAGGTPAPQKTTGNGVPLPMPPNYSPLFPYRQHVRRRADDQLVACDRGRGIAHFIEHAAAQFFEL